MPKLRLTGIASSVVAGALGVAGLLVSRGRRSQLLVRVRKKAFGAGVVVELALLDVEAVP